MKKITLATLLIFVAISANSQKSKSVKDTTTAQNYNRWTVEATVGQSKGRTPYAVGYYSSDPKTVFGQLQANSFSLGARYMMSSKFGIKLGLHYEDLKPTNGNGSDPFEMEMFGISVQGVVNALRLFDLAESTNRFGLLVHSGFKIDRMTSKTPDRVTPYLYNDYGRTEYAGGLVVGISPQYRFSKRMSVLLDVSLQNNIRQHFNWNGSYSDGSNNLNGQLINASLGLTYSLGNNAIHGDWAIIKDKNIQKIEALDKKISAIETQMSDSDKDGVPDYLDQENNSVAGVAVDSRGRMIDLNRNGVPDELERFVEKTAKEISEKSVKETSEDSVLRLINEGYVCVYFDSGKTQATEGSTGGIDFILTFLRNHPNNSIEIMGHADEIGAAKTNNTLAEKRAENIKNVLVKAGINPSKLIVISKGIDNSVAPDSV